MGKPNDAVAAQIGLYPGSPTENIQINERARKTNIGRKFDDKLGLYEVIIDFNYMKLYK